MASFCWAGLFVVGFLMVSRGACSAPLKIEIVAVECKSTAPASMSVLELAAICETNESKLQSGSYLSEQRSSLPSESAGRFSDDAGPDYDMSTQTLFFKGAKVRTKRVYANADTQAAHDDEWAFDGAEIRSLSEASQGARIQKNTGQLNHIANWFRDNLSPLGFASEGKLSTWIRDLHAQYPAELKTYECEHPSRGKVLVLDVNPSHKMFFDPKEEYRCFGQILYANRDNNEISRCYEVESYINVNDINLPKLILAASFGWAADKKWLRKRDVSISFTGWAVNPDLDDRVFTLEFPAEFQVYDSINKRAVTNDKSAGTNLWLIIAGCIAGLCALFGWRMLRRRNR